MRRLWVRIEAQVGGHLVACLQQHDVAGHQLLGGHSAPLPVAQHQRPGREHVADGVQGLLGLALLDEADDGVDEHHAEDHTRVHPVLQDARYRARRR
jgi:hypothetical protein